MPPVAIKTVVISAEDQGVPSTAPQIYFFLIFIAHSEIYRVSSVRRWARYIRRTFVLGGLCFDNASFPDLLGSDSLRSRPINFGACPYCLSAQGACWGWWVNSYDAGSIYALTNGVSY